MSLAITHFAVGGTCTALVALYLLPPTEYARTLVLLGGGWGMVPDIHWVAPLYAPELEALHGSVVTNLFWFHQTLDTIDPTGSYTVAALALGVFIAVVSLGDHWAYRTAERASTPAAGRNVVRSLTVLVRTAGLLGVVCGAGLLAVGSVHPSIDAFHGLYLGVGAALTGVGTVALGGQLTVAPWVTNRLPAAATRTLAGVESVLLAIGGATLAASPLRNGVTAYSALVSGVGGLLLVVAVLCGQLRLQR